MSEDKCIFCEIIAGKEPARFVKAWKDATQSPQLTGKMMKHASELARERGQCNIITSVGKDATQSVFHLHIHVVPRCEGDGLKLPWSNQK